MADLFEACGIEYSQDELSQCYDEQRDASEDELAICSDSLGQIEDIMATKSGIDDACDEVAEYDAE